MKNWFHRKKLDPHSTDLIKNRQEISGEINSQLDEKRAMISRVLEPPSPSLERVKKLKYPKNIKENYDGIPVRIHELECTICFHPRDPVSFMCPNPKCKTLYCIPCAISLYHRRERCWVCNMEITWDFIKQYYEKYEILARFCAESLEEVQILHHGIIGRLFIKNSELVWECMAFHWWWNPLKDFYQWRNSLETIELQVIKELEPFFFDRNDMIFDTAVICVYLLNRKYKEALEIINDLIKRTPTEISFLGFRSLILMNLLDFDAAITEFNDLIKLDGSNVIWFINKALALGACNNAGAALQCLEIANTLSHNHNEILWNKGVILLNSGDIPQATRYFDEFYHNESKKFNANFILYDIIHLFESIGRSDEAVKYRSMIGSYRDTHPKHE